MASFRAAATDTAPVRERLLDAASECFYRDGIAAVGIQQVLATADAAKASLYQHFGSKDDLVAAYLARQASDARARITSALEAAPPTPAARLNALFELVAQWASSKDFRGCPFQAATAERLDRKHPAQRVIAEQRAWLKAQFRALAASTRSGDPSALAGAWQVLYDGAVAAAFADGNPAPARAANWAAQKLLDAES